MRSSATRPPAMSSSDLNPRAIDAGAVSNASGSARRGSALVIVVGTLALISVFAAIYISIGQSDRRSAATVTQRADLGNITDAYADHIAGIIAGDRFDTVMQMIDAQGNYQIPRRALTDAPYTDWTLRSEADQDWLLFNPTGGNGYAKPRSVPGDDPRVASDPWLASLRPTYLGDSFARPFSTNDPFRFYLDNRDWYQISNLADDGRFVNLFNLRPGSRIGAATGGFDAEPGFGITDFGNNRRVRRMSEGLSLFRLVDPTSEFSAIESFDPVAENAVWLPGVSDPVTPGATLPSSQILNTPAVFSMYQRFAFLPLNQPFPTYTSRTSNRPNEIATWQDPDFPAYQWADADADGMADSRWIELTSVRRPANGNNRREDLTSFYDSSQFRVFAGIRVVDLSAMVNINTATDGLTPPTENYPLGITPAEIDLRRLLTMQDAAREYAFEYQDAGLQPLSMQDLHKPLRVARNAQRPGESDYRGYAHELSALDAPLNRESPSMLSGRYASDGIRRGIVEYAPLGPAFRGIIPVAPLTTNTTLVEGSSFQRLGGTLTASEFNSFADARANSFALAGRLDPSRLGSSSLSPFFAESDLIASAYYTPSATPPVNPPFNFYGTDDLAELLAYHGLNDPDTVSRLERNALGRYQGNDLFGNAGGERFSPLMSTRPLTLDRDRHGHVMPRGRLPYLLANNDARNLDRVIDGRIAPESMAMFELSPRTVMTPINGSVPLNPVGVAGAPVATRPRENPALPQSLTLESDATILLEDAQDSPQAAFDLFYGALAGELETYRTKRSSGVDGPPATIINQIWQADLSLSRQSPYATLFYGHRGPELALRVAAHAAVNMVDLFNENSASTSPTSPNSTSPTIATLILHNELADTTPFAQVARMSNEEFDLRDLGTGPARQLAIYYPGLAKRSTRLDLDAPRRGEVAAGVIPNERRILPGASQNPKPPLARQAVNVIGIQPTPIITEVSSFYLYHDASESAGGLPDSTNVPNPAVLPPTTAEVTIRGSLDPSNPDLLAAVFAVQLHNPFDEAINLSGVQGSPEEIMWRKRNADTGSNFDQQNNLIFDYYIEFNGYFFKLGEFWEFNPADTSPEGFDADERQILQDNRLTTPLVGDAPLLPNDPTTREFQYRGVTLEAGETRVFYAMAHPRYDNEGAIASANGGLAQKWVNALTGYGDALPIEYTDTSIDYDVDQDGKPDGLDARGWTGPGQEWIENQFTVDGNRAARIHPFDPKTGLLVLEDTFTDFNSTPGTTVQEIGEAASPTGPGTQIPGRVAEPNQVRLWRKYVLPSSGVPSSPDFVESEEGTQSGATTRRNLVENDILIDRIFLRPPAGASGSSYLDVGLPSGENAIAGSVSINESYEASGPNPCAPTGPVTRNDNTGLSITRWATVRRRDVSSPLADQSFGRVLPWMIQSRLDPASTYFRSTNKLGEDDAAPEAFDDALTVDLFFDSCGPALNLPTSPARKVTGSRRYDFAYTPTQLLNRSGRDMNIQTMRESPFEKGAATGFIDGGQRFKRAGEKLGSNSLTSVSDGLHDGSSPLRPEVVLSKNLRASRVADALLVMGIGPTWAPDLQAISSGYEYSDGEWMTLTEAFAVALGYENIPDPDPADLPALVDANIVWHDAAREYADTISGTTRAEYVLDNLHLRLDDYVSFINSFPQPGETGLTGKSIFSIDPGSPLGNNNTDYRRGTGAPVALGVIDRLRPFGVLDLAGDDPTDDTRRLTRAIPGLVNVQTAPLRVLRLLPGLTPSIEQYRPDEGSPSVFRSEWWGAGSAFNSFAPAAGGAQLTQGVFEANPDIAAGIVAYRDRLAATPRNLSVDPAWPLTDRLVYQPLAVVSNSPNAQWFTRNLQAELVNPPSSAQPFDRSGIAGVSGLRGSPMFFSLGELLMVATDEPNSLTTPDRRRHLTTQVYFGGDQQLGVDENGQSVSIDPKFKTNDGNDPWAGVTPDDYAQRLAIAAALSNTTTVRSDYFAAWMILQGFRESDVAGLRPDDPLVPSFKRRYLMVIDRSNVTEPGQAPRIVLFKELPL